MSVPSFSSRHRPSARAYGSMTKHVNSIAERPTRFLVLLESAVVSQQMLAHTPWCRKLCFPECAEVFDFNNSSVSSCRYLGFQTSNHGYSRVTQSTGSH
jgi:hypothetical protein